MKQILYLLIIPFLLLCSGTIDIKERNVIYLRIDSESNILLNWKPIQFTQLKDTLKLIIVNAENDYQFPEKRAMNIPIIGDTMVSMFVISVASENNTKYNDYIGLQNEIEKAINELRDEFSIKYFAKHYALLNEEQQKAINKFYPLRISEAEPFEYKN